MPFYRFHAFFVYFEVSEKRWIAQSQRDVFQVWVRHYLKLVDNASDRVSGSQGNIGSLDHLVLQYRKDINLLFKNEENFVVY